VDFGQLVRAALVITDSMQEIEPFLATHGVLGSIMGSLRDTSRLLEKDTGADPAITTTLRTQYAEGVIKTAGLAKAIAERPTERPDAQEVSRQIEALANVLLARLPPELKPQPMAGAE
jgi:hypothetical protein